ncbi:MAG: hypothetical protein ABJK20_17900 [Halieaceae bacterium]
MKRVMTIAMTLLLMGSLYGCLKEDPEDALPEGYKRSLEKADGVEQQLQDTANKRLGELEASSQ